MVTSWWHHLEHQKQLETCNNAKAAYLEILHAANTSPYSFSILLKQGVQTNMYCRFLWESETCAHHKYQRFAVEKIKIGTIHLRQSGLEKCDINVLVRRKRPDMEKDEMREQKEKRKRIKHHQTAEYIRKMWRTGMRQHDCCAVPRHKIATVPCRNRSRENAHPLIQSFQQCDDDTWTYSNMKYCTSKEINDKISIVKASSNKCKGFV